MKPFTAEDARLLASPSEKRERENQRFVDNSLKRIYELIKAAATSGANTIQVPHVTEWAYGEPMHARDKSIAVTILNKLQELGYTVTQEKHIGGKTTISW